MGWPGCSQVASIRERTIRKNSDFAATMQAYSGFRRQQLETVSGLSAGTIVQPANEYGPTSGPSEKAAERPGDDFRAMKVVVSLAMVPLVSVSIFSSRTASAHLPSSRRTRLRPGSRHSAQANESGTGRRGHHSGNQEREREERQHDTHLPRPRAAEQLNESSCDSAFEPTSLTS